MGLDVCRALDHAHRRKFVHTELNPSKIVFGDDRRLRVIDFGLARLLGVPTWAQPDSVPTHVAWYAAPEQALGEPIDGRRAYRLESPTGQVLMYGTEQPGVNLEPYVGRNVEVLGHVAPRVNVRPIYMIVVRARLLP